MRKENPVEVLYPDKYKRPNMYKRGVRFELYVKKVLEDMGFAVFRQARSAFPDLIVMRDGRVFFVECKVRSRKYVSEEPKAHFERGQALELIQKTGFPVIFALKEMIKYKGKTYKVVFYDIDGKPIAYDDLEKVNI